MSKNPFLNALGATAYISVIATVLFYGPKVIGPIEESVIIPIAMLSLLVFSVVMMGYFFVYQPLLLFFANKPQEATRLFLMTAFSFACITVAVVATWMLLSV